MANELNPQLRALSERHAVSVAKHRDLFSSVTAQALQDQQQSFDRLTNTIRRRHDSLPAPEPVDEPWTDDCSSTLGPNDRGAAGDNESTHSDPTLIREDSRIAQIMSLEPVRDVVINGIVVMPQDRELDFIGSPYHEAWTVRSGNPLPGMQSVWANVDDGTFGFDHDVNGTVTGRQTNSGAGLFVRFVPHFTPGYAQIRPYAPFRYQWSSISFKSREDNLATMGIRVFSWDLAGNGYTVEQDFQYTVWTNTMVSDYFGSSNSPNWFADAGPESRWEDDNAFIYGNEAPYFRTQRDRVYMAAIWCFGMCWSVSRQNRPGGAIGRLQAKVPWVVIGYQ